jgi:hypothetical protein
MTRKRGFTSWALVASVVLGSVQACSVEDGRDFEFEKEGVEEPRGGSSIGQAGGTATTGGISATGGRASGTGGARALDCSSATMGNDLEPKNGWVSRDSNCAGIQGLYWTLSDMSSTITPVESADISMPACVQGKLAQVVDGDFDSYWGATLGLTLNQPGPTTERDVYNATAAGVSGFRFVIGGDNPPAPGRLRFNVIAEDEQIYCVPLTHGSGTKGAYEISFDQLRRSCWNTDSTAPLDPSRILVAQFSLVTSSEDAPSYSFCVESLSAIRSVPGGGS